MKLRILETHRTGALLAATFKRRDLTTAHLLQSFFLLPLVTLKIAAAIHWEALQLWVKGMRLVSPASPISADAALNSGLASGKSTDYNRQAAHTRGRTLWSGEGRARY